MPTQPPIDQDEERTSQTPATPVTGMTCGNCARHVTEALQSVQGVRSAMVSLDARKASVRWAAGTEQNAPELIRAVENAGYQAKVIAIDADEHGEHKLAGWQLTLWIGLLATALLMMGEWVFQLGGKAW